MSPCPLDPGMRALSPRRRALGTALLGLALACAAPDVYWSKAQAGEKQFQSASRACNRNAIEILAEESGQQCGFNSESGGTRCRRPNLGDPIQAEQAERREGRRLRFLYGECMQSRGWVSNYDGQGFKGRY